MFASLINSAYKNTYNDNSDSDSLDDNNETEGFRWMRRRMRNRELAAIRNREAAAAAAAKRAREVAAAAKRARDVAASARRAKEASAAAKRAKEATAIAIAAENAAIAAEKARIEIIRIDVCRKVNAELPKLQALIAASKKELELLKSRKQKCMDDYDKDCPSNLSNQLNEKQSLYANLKSTMINIESAYQQEECVKIKSCDNELQASTLAVSNYDTGASELSNAQSKLNICNDPYRNKCSSILNDLESSRENINNDIVYMQDKVEGMTIQNNIDNNTELNTLLNDNNLNLNRFKILQKPNADHTALFDNEVCKNIVLTTIGSVMLYYLFFEI
tara:strand:+ start:10001 stop:10999 length:999 start_codon:yes stop_codon:yes gene_type:complete